MDLLDLQVKMADQDHKVRVDRTDSKEAKALVALQGQLDSQVNQAHRVNLVREVFPGNKDQQVPEATQALQEIRDNKDLEDLQDPRDK